MEALIITLAGTGVIALILNIWLGTKSGKKMAAKSVVK